MDSVSATSVTNEGEALTKNVALAIVAAQATTTPYAGFTKVVEKGEESTVWKVHNP